jgi:hypothetical protein
LRVNEAVAVVALALDELCEALAAFLARHHLVLLERAGIVSKPINLNERLGRAAEDELAVGHGNREYADQ